MPKQSTEAQISSRPLIRTWDGQRIFALRVRYGSVARPLSYRDMAEFLNRYLPHENRVAQTSLERWEKSRAEPPLPALQVMAWLARKSFEEFALGTEAPPPNGRKSESPGKPHVESRGVAGDEAPLHVRSEAPVPPKPQFTTRA